MPIENGAFVDDFQRTYTFDGMVYAHFGERGTQAP